MSRTGAVMAAIRSRAASGALAPGERLPSIRRLAHTMGVSPSTVVEAYDRLAADGFIRARRGSGFYLARKAIQPQALGDRAPRQDRAIDPFWVSRQSLDADPAAQKPGCGWLPADWMPTTALRRAIRALARAGDDVLTDYGTTRGSPVLRRLLLARLIDNGLHVSPDQVMLAGSGTQAIDLICRFLLRTGDTVLVDDPCYFNFRALLRAHPVTVVGVQHTPTGPDLGAFEAVVKKDKPRLYLTNSALHNPTGATLSAQTAHRLLAVAAAHDLTIVEDEIFGDFEPEPSARLATLDGLDRVIQIGSFSKTLSAAVRCGWIAARGDWIEGLVDMQVATSFGGSSPVATHLIAEVLSGGSYRKHIDALHRRLAGARRATATRLAALDIRPWLEPRGGFFLWCRLPGDLDGASVARAALEDNVVLAPGNVFSVSQSAASFLRFNVAQSSDPHLIDVLQRAMEAAAR